MNFQIIALVFVVIFIAELPDKSMFASLILSQKFPRWYVWMGASAAFLVHVIIAVTAGKLLTLLPNVLHETIVALLFFGGAALVFFGKHGVDDNLQKRQHAQRTELHSFWKVYATSFGIVFIGEWGDITQIATANYAASYHDPWSVAVGATLGLWAVTALAVTVGSKALTLVPAKVLQRITGTILLLFGILSVVSAFR